MSESPQPQGVHVKTEPKFCRCRVCHEHFYGDTIAQARAACLDHALEVHPDWGTSACYCPD